MKEADWWWTNFRGLMMLKRKLPEKLYALSLLPRQIMARPVSNPLSINAWRAHFAVALQSATALASEYFEVKRNA